MSTMGKKKDIEYWSERLEETSAKAAELTTKYHMNQFKLTYDELYEAMGLLMDYRSYSTLLNRTVTEPDDPKSLWKRIRNQ